MRAAIYNLSSIRAPITGIGRYALELLKTQLDVGNEVFAFSNGVLHDAESVPALLVQLEAKNSSVGQGQRTMLGRIPYARDIYRALQNRQFSKVASSLLQSGVLFHDLNYTPCNQASKSISTVYDLSNIYAPGTHPKHRVHYLNRYLGRLQVNEQPIITISQSIKNNLIEKYQLCPDRIHVTYLAADSKFKPRTTIACETVLGNKALQYGRYFLSVGTLEPRKNLERVIQAFTSLDPEIQHSCPLVIVGATGWKSSTLEKQIVKLQKLGVVRRLNYVSNTELPILYSGALAFVYPSLYEGFGLPLLEAMQSGCACISSNNGALSEVAGGSSLEVDPHNKEEIAQALSILINDDQYASKLSSLGIQRANNFSWEKTAKLTQQIYDTYS